MPGTNTPAKFGCVVGKGHRDGDGAIRTDASERSARATTASKTAGSVTAAASTCGPRTRATLSASCSCARNAATTDPAMWCSPVTVRSYKYASSSGAGCSQSSRGTDTYTGPVGWVVASRTACDSVRVTSSAANGSCEYLTNGCGNIAAAMLPRNAS